MYVCTYVNKENMYAISIQFIKCEIFGLKVFEKFKARINLS